MAPGKEPTGPVGRAVDRLVVVVGIHQLEEAALVMGRLVVVALGNRPSLGVAGSLVVVEIHL